MHKSSITVAAALVGGANAFWRMECPGRVALARIDPIVQPGEMSSHLHAVHGSSGFSEDATSATLLEGNCTSCRVTQDKSAYWTPALYFQDAKTQQFEAVEEVGGMLAYYLLYGDKVTAFPTGFQMIAGDTFRRNYTLGDPTQPDPDKSSWASLGQTTQSDLAQRAIGFNCLDYSKDPEGTLYRHYLPKKDYLDANCVDGIRFELMFPSCWKGGDEIDSANHKDHVAYPDLVMTGDCPSDYPERLPSMLFETIWNTPAFKDRDGQFVIANGDTTGFGYHGDFMMGWDEDLLQQAVETCTNPSGLIEDCPLFDVVDQSVATQCEAELPSGLFSEDVLGPRVGLPGGVEITFTDTGPPAAGSSAPALTYAPGSKPTDSASPLLGDVFKEHSSTSSTTSTSTTSDVAALAAEAVSTSTSTTSTTSSTTTTSTTSTTAAPTTTSAPEPTKSYWSTQLVTAGNVVSKIYWEQDVVTVTEEIDATTTIFEPGPSAKAKRHLHHHAHHGH